ncbi:MAG: hypothetical protein SV186_05755 [Candidatus Nanohaloarchaea archaeon]|nr:hypothetical protein [Candidatus Nanohaloarchaea archaeon]
MDELKRRLASIFLHFDDQLGVFSALGSAVAGGGLIAVLSEPGFNPPGSGFLALLAGLALIVLDYFR